MQDDASGGLDVTLLVAVAALTTARVEYSLDRRCPQQSLNPLGKRPLDHILHVFVAAGAQESQILFMRGGARKKRSLLRCKSVKDCARTYPPCEAQPRRVALMLRLAAAASRVRALACHRKGIPAKPL